jgi:glutamine amidotransferase
VTVSLSLPTLAAHGATAGTYADGWGVGYYEALDVRLIKEAAAAAGSEWVQFVATRDLRSQLVIAHTRRATRGMRTYPNAQPFVRELAGRAHLFAHNGDLPGIFDSSLFVPERFKPIGETDSERAFCALLERMAPAWGRSNIAPTLCERFRIVASFAEKLKGLGPANFLYSDGEFLFAHGHRRKHAETGRIEAPGLVLLQRQCNEDKDGLVTHEVTIQGKHQLVTLFASVPLTRERWEPLAEGELVAASRGQIVARQLAHEDPVLYEPPVARLAST